MAAREPGPWESDHQYSDKFLDKKFGKELLNYKVTDGIVPNSRAASVPTDTPAYLAPLYQFPILTPQGEWMMFMKMNYAKWRTCEMIRKRRPKAKCDAMLKIAYDTRNDIANHNMRLVVSLAKKQKHFSMNFEEWIGNGNMSLLRAIDKFNCNTPNKYRPGHFVKFSTYAVWSINKNYWRDHMDLNKVMLTGDIPIDETPVADPLSLERDEIYSDETERLLRELDEILTTREKEIIKGRFGLGRIETTLERLGVELNLTKERVRQIQVRAIRLLKESFESAERPIPKQRTRPRVRSNYVETMPRASQL